MNAKSVCCMRSVGSPEGGGGSEFRMPFERGGICNIGRRHGKL